MNFRLKENELRLEIENLQNKIQEKDNERRNRIRKEFGYDEALISLQNDINDYEIQVTMLKKENEDLRNTLQNVHNKTHQTNKKWYFNFIVDWYFTHIH